MWNFILGTFLSTHAFYFVIHLMQIIVNAFHLQLYEFSNTLWSDFSLLWDIAWYRLVVANHLLSHTLQRARLAKTIVCTLAEAWNLACYAHMLIRIIFWFSFFDVSSHLCIETTSGSSFMFCVITVTFYSLLSRKIICSCQEWGWKSEVEGGVKSVTLSYSLSLMWNICITLEVYGNPLIYIN